MADRVHHAESPDPRENLNSPPETKPKPPPSEYVIQIPKDQVYRVPPPENTYRSQDYARRAQRRGRSRCCRCICCTAGALLVLVVALAATAGILYLIFRPKSPNYTVESLSIKGFNLTLDQTLSPEFDVTLRAENPNKKIGIHYRSGSAATVSYSGVDLCSGAWPEFYQGARNVTVFQTVLRGSGIRLSDAMNRDMAQEQSRGEVPLEIDIRVPVRVKFGAVTTWTITVKVRCDVTVDKLTADSKILSKTCRVKVDI